MHRTNALPRQGSSLNDYDCRAFSQLCSPSVSVSAGSRIHRQYFSRIALILSTTNKSISSKRTKYFVLCVPVLNCETQLRWWWSERENSRARFKPSWRRVFQWKNSWSDSQEHPRAYIRLLLGCVAHSIRNNSTRTYAFSPVVLNLILCLLSLLIYGSQSWLTIVHLTDINSANHHQRLFASIK